MSGQMTSVLNCVCIIGDPLPVRFDFLFRHDVSFPSQCSIGFVLSHRLFQFTESSLVHPTERFPSNWYVGAVGVARVGLVTRGCG